MEVSRPARFTNHPLAFGLRVLFSVYIALLVRLIVLSPLLCLLFPTSSPLRYFALLCPFLILFGVLPLRFSFAQAIMQNPFKAPFSFDTFLSLSSYFAKLKASLLHSLRLIKWLIPTLAALGYAYYYNQNTDAFTLLGSIESLGQWAGSALAFLPGLSGQDASALQAGAGIIDGFYFLGGILSLCLLILAYGVVRNSAYRYIWAVSLREQRNPNAENRFWLGRRWLLQIFVALINFLLLLPFLLRLKAIFTPLVSDISLMALFTASGNIIDPAALLSTLTPLLVAFFLLYLPLLAVRRMLTAFFIGSGLVALKSSETNASATEPASPSAKNSSAGYFTNNSPEE